MSKDPVERAPGRWKQTLPGVVTVLALAAVAVCAVLYLGSWSFAASQQAGETGESVSLGDTLTSDFLMSDESVAPATGKPAKADANTSEEGLVTLLRNWTYTDGRLPTRFH
jgi:hypothetical protein